MTLTNMTGQIRDLVLSNWYPSRYHQGHLAAAGVDQGIETTFSRGIGGLRLVWRGRTSRQQVVSRSPFSQAASCATSLFSSAGCLMIP